MHNGYYRGAMLVAASVLALIALGAYVTSRATAPQLDTHAVLNASWHSSAAVVVGFLALALAFKQSALAPAILSWTFLALFAIEGSIGFLGARVAHATFAPLVFSAAVAVAIVTSSRWHGPPELIDDRQIPYLRLLAAAVPPLLLLQTLLGAAYRHKLIGVIPHLAGAMIVSLAALIGATLVLNRCPEHRELRSAAKWLMAAVLAQVVLGVAAFAMQLLGLASTIALVIATASHVVGGSLTLAAGIAFAMRVQRGVRRAPAGALSLAQTIPRADAAIKP